METPDAFVIAGAVLLVVVLTRWARIFSATGDRLAVSLAGGSHTPTRMASAAAFLWSGRRLRRRAGLIHRASVC